MCHLYTYKMSADEMHGLMKHFKLIRTIWSERLEGAAPPSSMYPTNVLPRLLRAPARAGPSRA